MIKLLTDSVASIPAHDAEAMGIDVISLYVYEGDVEHVDAEMDLDAFYARLPQMSDDIPTSSQPSQQAFEEYFERAAAQGDEVLGVFISSKMSGTFDGALRAARAVHARNIDFKAAIVDTYSTGWDQAYCVLAAQKAIARGASLEESARAAVEAVERTRFLFSPTNLTFLQKGGRIGAAKALLGNLVRIVPVLTVRDGMPLDIAKARTQKKAIAQAFEIFKADAEEKGLEDAVVHYIGSPDDATEWARTVVEPFLGRAVRVLPVSPVVGLHVGPAMGIAYTCARPLEGKLTEKADLVAFVR
ncbi:DegV family protein [uncultured Slackia sp.]|uniref:DegV family protein n=1 Tax=uncultured Slackia sp. TaxID=665903 RepID=UPI0026E0C546|nr:DegV family protein [uncultured Slackia sp.]